MASSAEDAYSAMFGSLRHPARRKILRMLSENPMTFSQMLEELGIPGSHLTYHLENLGEFIVKTEDGKYKLSSVGESSVSIMKGAEEIPSIQAKKFRSLPLRWRAIVAFSLVGMILFASISVVQFASLSQLSKDYEFLEDEYEKLKAQNQQILPWSSAERAMIIIRDVAQIDTTKYETTLLSVTSGNRSDMGHIGEEILRYSLRNEKSYIDLVLRFRNNHFSLFQLSLVEGIPPFAPIYVQPQSANVLEAAKSLIDRYGASSGETYLEEMSRLLASANETSNEQTLGNIKLKMTAYGDNVELLLTYISNEHNYSAKSLRMLFQSNVLKELSDDWFLFAVSDAQMNISEQEAIQIARNAAQNFEWTADGATVSDFTVQTEPVSAVFYPHPRNIPLTLVPYWYITLYLDKVYPGGVNSITVGIWADTGEVANIQPLSSQVNT